MKNLFSCVLNAVLRLERQGKPCFEPFSRSARYQIQSQRCIIGHMIGGTANCLGVDPVDHPSVLRVLERSLGFDPRPYLNLLRVLQTAHDCIWQPHRGMKFLEAVILAEADFSLTEAEKRILAPLTANFRQNPSLAAI